MVICIYCQKPYERKSNLTRHIKAEHKMVNVPIFINWDEKRGPVGWIKIPIELEQAYIKGKYSLGGGTVQHEDYEGLTGLSFIPLIEQPSPELVKAPSGMEFEPVPVPVPGVDNVKKS